MASLNSFLFQIEGATEGSASARSPVLATIRQGKVLESVSFRGLGNGSLKNASDRSLRLFRRTGGGSQRIARLRAAGSGSVEGAKENGSEETVQDIIEKSKRVLDVQKELLQEIAERRKLAASIKSRVNNSSLESENSPSVTDEADVIHSISSTDPIDGSSDRLVLDKPYANGSLPYIPVMLPENLTSDFSPSSDESEGKPERIEVNLDSYEVDDKFSWSTKFDGKFASSEMDQEIFSLNNMSSLDLDSIVKAVEMNTATASPLMDSETSFPQTELEQSTLESLIDSMNDPTLEEITPEDENPGPLAGANVMNVILVAAECSPFSKTGGLGDVAGSLPKALARRGHRVMVVTPKYGNYPEAQSVGVLKRYKVAGQDMECGYFHAYIDGVDFVFVESAMFRGKEQDIYGGSSMDVFKRMVLLCKAAIEVPWNVPCGGAVYGDGNLVFIANDWHTALLPVYLKAYYRDNGLMTYTRSVLVIHNIAHQGRCPMDDFPVTDLPEHWQENFRLYDPVGGEHCNIFAAGIKAADRVVTVSHGYAWELKTPEGGWGLHNIIKECDWKLRGIVNGVDTEEWCPKLDVYLQSNGYENYTSDTVLTGKRQCKAALQRELGLPQRDDVPLIGFIGRLDGQKGVDIVADAIPWMMSQDVQLVMLGQGRHDLENMLKMFEGQYNDKARGWVGFSVKMAHRITAGADILLMPSRFEPCGLNQLYAMNYGTVPVVHAVGGLRDTVLPYDPFNDTGFGWTFDRAEAGKLIDTLNDVLKTYRGYKPSWEGLQKRGMAQDLSWDHAAELYEEVLVTAKYQW